MKQETIAPDPAIAALSKIPLIDTLLEVVCHSTGMGFAAVAKVTEDRWLACCVRDEIAFGLQPGGELPVKTTICDEIRQSREPVVIDHVAKDNIFAMHHTPAMYGLQSYISFPIILRNGDFFGTLCAIDPNPHVVKTPETMGLFKLLSNLIAFHLDAEEQLEAADTRLKLEQKQSLMREQFIAILGHDLRNPITAISTSAQFLLQLPLEQQVKDITAIIHNSSKRIQLLIENMLDFAMGHLGDGIVLNPTSNTTLAQTLLQVIAEIEVSKPNQQIQKQFDLSLPVYCDANRVAQLFSNLLRNAVSYGKPGEPVIVRAITTNDTFTLSVINNGEPIPAEKMAKLFQPFSRGEENQGQQGLGLGLYIAAEIAKAHGGTLTSTSDKESTKFTLEMPVRRSAGLPV